MTSKLLPRAALVSLLVLLGAASEPSRPFDWGDNTEAQYAKSTAACRTVRDRRPLASEIPKPAEAATLKGCDAEALYFGIGRPRDLAAARRCALAWPEGQAPKQVLDNTILLMAMFANGEGGRRDVDLALHISCGIESAPMENVLRIEALQDIKARGPGPKPFDFCDNVTSGMAAGFCTARQARRENVGRDRRVAELTRALTPSQRKAFESLRQAQGRFKTLRSRNEIDLSGTLRAAFVTEEEERQDDAFIGLLSRFEAGAFRKDVPAAEADRRLNAAYRRLQAGGPSGRDTITNTGVRDAQRAWIPYRDAWVAFAKARAPGAPTSGLVVALTEERTRDLIDLAVDWRPLEASAR